MTKYQLLELRQFPPNLPYLMIVHAWAYHMHKFLFTIPYSAALFIDTFFHLSYLITVKLVLSGHSKRRPKIGFHNLFLLNAGHNYCRMLQGEHSAILSTIIKLPFFIKIFVLSIFEWPLKTGFTVFKYWLCIHRKWFHGPNSNYGFLNEKQINSFLIYLHTCY